jgi:hypothetical protein
MYMNPSLPCPKALILSVVAIFLKLNIALYLSYNGFDSSNKVLSSFWMLLSALGGAGSTDEYGLFDNFSLAPSLAIQFNLSRASWHVSATSIAGSFLYFSNNSRRFGSPIAPNASPVILKYQNLII